MARLWVIPWAYRLTGNEHFPREAMLGTNFINIPKNIRQCGIFFEKGWGPSDNRGRVPLGEVLGLFVEVPNFELNKQQKDSWGCIRSQEVKRILQALGIGINKECDEWEVEIIAVDGENIHKPGPAVYWGEHIMGFFD